MDNIEVSVVILVKDGQKYLNSLLDAVFSQEIRADFEVIIIDSGSSDETPDIIRQYPVRLYQINEREFNHGLTRNFGISKAQGKYVILLTQDAVPFDNCWMERLTKNLDDNSEVAGVYSRQAPHADSGILTKIRVSRFFVSKKERREAKIEDMKDYGNLSSRERYYFCNFDNVSSCIRKSVWEKIPFPEADFAEDLEWSKKVLESGYKIIYEPDSVVYHSHDFSAREWYERNRLTNAKLYSLFGVSRMDNVAKVLIFSLIFTFRDFCSLLKNGRCFKDILSSFYLIPLFVVSGAWGQYSGIRDSKRRLL